MQNKASTNNESIMLTHNCWFRLLFLFIVGAQTLCKLTAAYGNTNFSPPKNPPQSFSPNSNGIVESVSTTKAGNNSRRDFLSRFPVTLAASQSFLLGVDIFHPSKAKAAAATTSTSSSSETTRQVIKVTPVAHTFVSASGSPAKPLRENDATRYLTNAKVVYMFYGSDSDGGKNAKEEEQLAGTVPDLTVQRKKARGPGVTPGDVKLALLPTAATPNNLLIKVANDNNLEVLKLDNKATALSSSITALVQSKVKQEGDTLFVSPIRSGGTAIDGKIVQDTADALGMEVGGTKSGGILSILLNGPRSPNVVQLKEGGYDISTILWYDI